MKSANSSHIVEAPYNDHLNATIGSCIPLGYSAVLENLGLWRLVFHVPDIASNALDCVTLLEGVILLILLPAKDC